MKLKDVLGIVTGRGFRVELDATGEPRLLGKSTEATPALVRVLKLHKDAIIRHLGGVVPERTKKVGSASTTPASARRLREFKWPGGLVMGEWPDDSPDEFPGRAVLWRFVGETEWRRVPGREGCFAGGG